MALPNSNVSFSLMNVALGRPAQSFFQLTNMYNFTAGVPTSGLISFGVLRGKSRNRFTDQTTTSILGVGWNMINTLSTNTTPVSGTTNIFNIPYDYRLVSGPVTITPTSFVATDWFSNTQDTRSAWVMVNGDLQIDAGVVFAPPVRKLYTIVYVTGNLILNGSMSMTARGASHSAIAASDIPIGIGTFSGVLNPRVPAAGASSVTNVTTGTNLVGGLNGISGTNGQTGGGGTGGIAGGNNTGTSISAAGTSFSGGSGGGGARGTTSTATGNGGAGGNASSNGDPTNFRAGGGAGNPGGNGVGTSGLAGAAGTGGVLIVVCLGTVSGTGTIEANGSKGGDANPATNGIYSVGGGGSGGGSVTLMYGSGASSINVFANGGAGGIGKFLNGGAGGNGTARKLVISVV